MISAIINIVLGAVFAALLIFAAITDVKARNIPNWICAAVCIPAVSRILWGGLSPLFAIGGLLAAGLPLLLLTFFKKGAFGGGDIKIAAAAGFFLGLEGAATMLFLSCLLFYLASYILQKKGIIEAGSEMAFVPYLAAGAIITYTIMLFGG